MRVTVELDLTTREGRAAMRAWLDATEEAPARRETLATLATPVEPWTPDTAFGEKPAGTVSTATPEPILDAPVLTFGQGDGDGAEDPAPAPLDPDPPAPAPDPAPVDRADVAPPDPKRPWTEPERVRAERLAARGLKKAAIAKELQRDRVQVANYLHNVKTGQVKSRLPRVAVSEAARSDEIDDYRRPPVMRAEAVQACRDKLAEAAAAREIREALYARPA